MRDCAIKVGMNDILISLESEAASLTMFEDPNIDYSLKKKVKYLCLLMQVLILLILIYFK